MTDTAQKLAALQWDDKFSVGNTGIDTQHKQLISLINDLSVASATGKGREIVGKTLLGVVDYTVTHFAYEENLMQTQAYPDYAAHKKQHDDLVQQASVLVVKQKSGTTMISIEVMNFLMNWLTHHINGTDKKLGAFLQTQGIN
ncbi:bacteriohemerythrin [Bdellovibrionota bacterium FG-2]